MSAAAILEEAYRHGFDLWADNDNLVVEADPPIPDGLLEMLRAHKGQLLAVLPDRSNGWQPEDWHELFNERAGFAEYEAGLSRTEAERQAFDCCMAEWLNRHPAGSIPDRCAWCRAEDSAPGSVILPFGTQPARHIWLHASCWQPWFSARQALARAVLHRMGLPVLNAGRQSDFPTDFEKSGD